MLVLSDYLSSWKEALRPLIKELIEKKGKGLFAETLFLSFLGARICYASERPLLLFSERRFREREELLSFLMRLKASGHTSVFAHSPVVVEADTRWRDKAPFLYKAWWTPRGDRICLNLRHFAEALEAEEFESLLSASLTREPLLPFPCFHLGFEGDDPILLEEAPLGEMAQRLSPYQERWARPEVWVISLSSEALFPFGWLAVVVEGMSRLFSHQFVRHTWLNFNQRSHRYTALDLFVCPPSFPEEAKVLYRKQIEGGLEAYQQVIELGVRKEDARFLTPQGAATSILATGPLFVWEDFVTKRRHPKAQWEIRRLARAVELVLAKLNV